MGAIRLKDSFTQVLRANGVALDETLTRFMDNEDIYEKFLYKFLNDKNFEQLQMCYTEENYEQAFRHAHTLKGVMANLGLMSSYKTLNQFVEKLRANEIDETCQQLYEEFCQGFEQTIEVIRIHAD